MPDFFEMGLKIVHLLAGGLWMGSTFYSATVLHPKTPQILSNQEEAEYYLLSITDGNRYKVLTAMFFVTVSGLLLCWLIPSSNTVWNGLIGIKIALMTLTVFAFVYTSWVLYPKRVFAQLEDIQEHRYNNTISRWIMLSTVILNLIAGIVAHACR
jgi:uncharacterized membrane protein